MFWGQYFTVDGKCYVGSTGLCLAISCIKCISNNGDNKGRILKAH